MKLVCPKGSFTTAVQSVAAVVPTRTPKEVLTYAKLSVTKDGAVLIGTDSEIGIRYHLSDVDAPGQGEMLLPTSRLLSILRELTGDTVTLQATGEGTTVVKGERAEYKLTGKDPAGFPEVAEFTDSKYHVVQAGLLRQLIRRTIFACDTDSSRYALGGVLMDIKGDRLTFAATDTRRLAVASGAVTQVGDPQSDGPPPVIPTKAMSIIERNLGDDADLIQIAVRNNDVLVKTRVSSVYSRLVEGRFPRYQDVLPTSCNMSIELPVGAFYAAVRQSQIVTSEESRGVEFAFSSGQLTLKSRAAEVGESTVELPMSYEGDDISIVFDPKFVSDFLKVLDAEQTITLQLIDSDSAAVFKTDDGYNYVVMPLARDH